MKKETNDIIKEFGLLGGFSPPRYDQVLAYEQKHLFAIMAMAIDNLEKSKNKALKYIRKYQAMRAVLIDVSASIDVTFQEEHNNARLARCEGPHVFHCVSYERDKSWTTCTRCGGELNKELARWYVEGLEAGKEL